ncbi:MAG: hypothetical protein JOY84_14730 [Curvibacter sp.]|nr:hypothetical protein [Curvibacter sp.]
MPAQSDAAAPPRRPTGSRRWRLAAAPLLTLVLAGLLLTAACEWAVGHGAQGRVSSAPETTPEQDVALLVAGPRTFDGSLGGLLSPAPVRSVARLWQLGKLRAVLVSGPQADRLRRELVEAGLPPEYVRSDTQARGWVQALVRARAVHGVQDLLLVAPHGPLERGLYLAQALDLPARGLLSSEAASGPLDRLRGFGHEALARVRLVLRVWLGRLPSPAGPAHPEPLPMAPRLA